MFKNLAIGVLMVVYLYTLTFDIFLNQKIRIPTPLFSAVPLIVLFGSFKQNKLLYGREFIYIGLGLFLYYVLGMADIKSFYVNLIIIVVCGMYFNFYVRKNRQRFNYSVLIFILLLLLSSIVMLLNHKLGPAIDLLRVTLLGREIEQSPSGIAASIFTFGYQVAAFSTFAFLYTMKYRWPFYLQAVVLSLCLIFIYFGMQRSAVVTFVVTVLLFLVVYYRSKAIFAVGVLSVVGFLLFNFINTQQANSSTQYDNVFAKNERKSGENRSALVTENLEIYGNYPYGLIFYGKSWSDVTRNSHIFGNGLTSHNAYLMFITYLGPFLGVAILLCIFYRPVQAFLKAISDIKGRQSAMLICLSFALLAVSINSLFHNGWLLDGNGPTVFLFFATLHRSLMDDL